MVENEAAENSYLCVCVDARWVETGAPNRTIAEGALPGRQGEAKIV